MSSEAKCPFHQTAGGGTGNKDWWPNQLRLDLLNQHSDRSNPLGSAFDYRKAFKGLLGRNDAGWTLTFQDGKGEQELGFALDEVRVARLVPVVDFKGRKKAAGPAQADAPAAQDGGQDR